MRRLARWFVAGVLVILAVAITVAFRPRCPVDPPDKVWIERRTTWLAQVSGLERCRNVQVVLSRKGKWPRWQ
jgi:hypothetical protein